jgi:signal peptidase I
MIQYLRFDKSLAGKAEFAVIAGGDAQKYFFRFALWVLLLLYSTLFLAVAIPFAGTYFIGGMLSMIVLVRLVNDIVKYRRFKGGKITVDVDSVELWDAGGGRKIKAEDITYIEVNVLGNIVFREKYASNAFPLFLLKREDRLALKEKFQDMAPKRSELFLRVYDFFEAILVAFILAMHIRQFIIQAYFIPTGSMEDTLLVGDHLLVEKITYGPILPRMIGMKDQVHMNFLGLRKVQRGDIIIFRPPNEEEKDYIKRCIAVEGDEYHIKDGYVWINGIRQEEPYIKGLTSYRGFSERKLEGIVPKGMVIAMGDNRENSSDSRAFGYLPVERIKGKALLLYWNTSQIKNLDFSRMGLIK